MKLPYRLALLIVLILPAVVHAQVNLFTFAANPDGNSLTITGPNTLSGTITIPTSISGYAVTTIAVSAFTNDTGLTNVIIPIGITNIGNFAFASCSNLSAVYAGGNAPAVGSKSFLTGTLTTLYYLPGTTGWPTLFGGIGTILIPAPITVSRLAGTAASIPYTTLSAAWDASLVTLKNVRLTTTNDVTVGTNSSGIAYPAAAADVADQIVYTIANKGFPQITNTGVINIKVILPSPPQVATMTASLVTGSTAQMNGFVLPQHNEAATYWFQWGAITNDDSATNYANTTAAQILAFGTKIIFVTGNISGLTLGGQYHYRLVASNSLGVAYGGEQRLATGLVAAWGQDNGDGDTVVPGGLSNVVAVAAGASHSLALRNDGTVTAWGNNIYGQTTVPAGLSNVVAVAGGYGHSLAVRSNGAVVAWGAGMMNRDAFPDYGQSIVPAGLSNAVAVAAGQFHSLALRRDGTVVAWGFNSSGQTIVPVGLSNAVAVAAGANHSLALLNDGTVVAWGNNGSDQSSVPAGLNNVVAVAAGWNYNLALRSDGTVVGWGDDSNGQTGVPGGLNNAIAVAASEYQSFALRSDGTVITWGANFFGEVLPSGLSGVFGMAAGTSDNLALIASVNTTATLTTSANPANFNQAIILTAAINPVVAGISPPAGDSVIFYDGATVIGTSTLVNGMANLTNVVFAAGNHHLTAVYVGGVNYLGSTSVTVTQVVNDGTPQTIVQQALLPNHTFQISFQTIPNAQYYVLYSTNLLTDWTLIQPAIKGTGSLVRWLDQGPPQTPSIPGTDVTRFYRVIQTN